MTIGGRIRILRKSKDMTQAEVAKKLSVKRETVNQWENNFRDLKTKHTIKLADLFNVSTDYLLGKTKAKTLNIELRSVCEYTNLSEEAVNNLIKLDTNLFDWFLSNDDTVQIMKDMFSYAQTKNKSFYASVIEKLALICN